MNDCIIEIKNLHKKFKIEKKFFKVEASFLYALKNISFEVKQSQTLGIIGESGSGKTTLAKIITGIYDYDAGSIFFKGENIEKLGRVERARKIQLIFQDPFMSLNPKLSVYTIMSEVIKNRNKIDHKPNDKNKILSEIYEILDLVGLLRDCLYYFPHQFSGGQRQRLVIARALAMRPEVLICDEPVSSLDISIQAQILNLLKELKEKQNLTYIFISHDFAVVSYICDDVIVLKDGQIIEKADVEKILSESVTDYTKMLINAASK